MSRARSWGLSLAVAFAAMVMAPPAFTQSDTATISGYVRDASGSSVPNANVTVRNIASGVARTTTSNQQGLYSVPNLPPATYAVEVSAAGFKKYEKTGVVLTAGISVGADADLQVGQTTETVEVSANAAAVQTETATVGKTITTLQAQNLQLNGRNPIFLALLKPGVAGGSLAGFNRGLTSGGFNINGSRSQDNLITFDGAVGIRTRSNGTSIGVADLDATQEVQVLTANYNAEYGRSAGGQIRIITKSGSSQFHGNAYEYFRNQVLDANTWSRNFAGQARAPFRYNQFGYNFSGPVILPGFNKDRNKLFFLWSQEFQRFRQTNTAIARVPTLNERGLNAAGQTVPIDLSRDVFAGRNIIDPQTGQPFPGNTIPVNRFSPNGIALLRTYPLPTPGFQLGTSNWFAQGGYFENHRKQTVAIDALPAENHFLKFRLQQYRYDDFNPFSGTYGLTPQALNRPNDTASLSHVWTINPTTINEFLVTASADRVRINVNTSSGLFDRTRYGLNYPYLFPEGKEIPNKIPTINIGNGYSDIDGGPYPSSSAGPIYVLSNNLTKILGNHQLKLGVLFERSGQNDFDQINVAGVPGGTNNQNGRFGFSNTYGSNFALTNAALGLFDTYAEIGRRAYTPYRGHMIEYFVQDSWRVTNRLRVELGMRHSFMQPFYSLWRNMVVFDPAAYNPARAVQVNAQGNPIPGTGDPLNGIVVPGTGFPDSATGRVNNVELLQNRFTGGSKEFSDIHKFNIAPRVGLAYSFNNKTVIRSGIGRFFQRLGVSDSIFLGGNPPLQPTASVARGLVDNPGGTQGSSFPLLPTTQDRIFPNLEAWNWNVTFEREIGFETTVNIGYVGRRGLNLQRERNINQLPVGTCPGGNCPGGANVNQLRPFRGYGPIRMTNNEASSMYNGLQLEVNKRFSKGLTYGFAYTLSKSYDDSGNDARTVLPNAYDARGFWGPSGFDRRHVAVLNVIYQLPFFNNSKGLVRAALGGWQVTGVSQWQTGTPFTVTGGQGDDYAGVGQGSGNQFWALNGPVTYNRQFSNGNANTGDQNFWFNPTVFSRPANGTIVSGTRSAVYNPGFQNHNIGLFKTFRITETQNLLFRAEGFNWVNHPNWDGAGGNPNDPATFGKVLSRSSNRTVQLSLRYSF